MSRRPRTSTIVLTALFLAVFALYIWVRPPTHSTGSAAPAGNSHPAPSHTRSPSPSPTPTEARRVAPRASVG